MTKLQIYPHFLLLVCAPLSILATNNPPHIPTSPQETVALTEPVKEPEASIQTPLLPTGQPFTPAPARYGHLDFKQKTRGEQEKEAKEKSDLIYNSQEINQFSSTDLIDTNLSDSSAKIKMLKELLPEKIQNLDDDLKIFKADGANAPISNKYILYGEPGTGKTETVRWLAERHDGIYHRVLCASLINEYAGSGASGVKKEIDFIRKLQRESGKVIFVLWDEIDRIAQINSSSLTKSTQEEKKSASYCLANCFDEFEGDPNFIFFCNTNQKTNVLFPVLVDRFSPADFIEYKLPDQTARKALFKQLVAEYKIDLSQLLVKNSTIGWFSENVQVLLSEAEIEAFLTTCAKISADVSPRMIKQTVKTWCQRFAKKDKPVNPQELLSILAKNRTVRLSKDPEEIKKKRQDQIQMYNNYRHGLSNATWAVGLIGAAGIIASYYLGIPIPDQIARPFVVSYNVLTQDPVNFALKLVSQQSNGPSYQPPSNNNFTALTPSNN